MIGRRHPRQFAQFGSAVATGQDEEKWQAGRPSDAIGRPTLDAPPHPHRSQSCNLKSGCVSSCHSACQAACERARTGGVDFITAERDAMGIDHQQLGAGLAELRLRALGLTHVEVLRRCTVEDSRLFSYRRDGVTGRMGAAICLQAGA